MEFITEEMLLYDGLVNILLLVDGFVKRVGIAKALFVDTIVRCGVKVYF